MSARLTDSAPAHNITVTTHLTYESSLGWNSLLVSVMQIHMSCQINKPGTISRRLLSKTEVSQNSVILIHQPGKTKK